MKHLDHQTLWELGRSSALRSEAQAHLDACTQCAAALREVQDAQKLLVAVDAPVLSEVSAKRIGHALMAEFDKSALSAKSIWGQWFPPLALATACAVAAVVYLARNDAGTRKESPVSVSRNEPVVSAAPAPSVSVAPPLTPRLLASVSKVRRGHAANQALEPNQQLDEGTTVSTTKGGALWLNLPDGSRAGLTGNSEVRLSQLNEKSLGLEITRGELVVMAKHLPQRVLSVRAGEVEVVDIGTRFVVSRDVLRVLVAVEEGSVEMRTPRETVVLTAGQSAEWRNGKLRRQSWANEETAAPIEKSDSGTSTPAQPQEQPRAPRDPDEEWETPTFAPTAPPPPPTGADSGTHAVRPPEKPAASERESEFSLAGLERKLRGFTRHVQQGFVPVNVSQREARAKEISRLADEGNCEEALRRAELWLRVPTTAPEEDRLKTTVMRQKLRCLTRLKRAAEADDVLRQLGER